MRMFSEETPQKSNEIVVFLTKQEGRTIIDALKFASETRPKKKTWKKVLIEFETKAAVY